MSTHPEVTAPTMPSVVERAGPSLGGSSRAVHRMVARVLARRHPGGGTLVDVGCGRGDLQKYVSPHVTVYLGADAVRYEKYPAGEQFFEIDLDAGRVPLPDASAEVVTAVETIEHLENPRAFCRELRRLAKPGGLILVTTPNQLSLMSLLTLLTKKQFNAFQEAPGLYPAHLTALLEIDLWRIARECGLGEIEIAYSNSGRIPGAATHWPALPGFRGRLFSDNLLMSARVPGQG